MPTEATDEKVLSMEKNSPRNVKLVIYTGPPESLQRLQVRQDRPMSYILDMTVRGLEAGRCLGR